MLKVYHFILDPRVGGPHIYVKSVARALASEIKSTIVTAGKGLLTDISLINIRHYWKPLYFFEIPLNVCLIFFLSITGKISFRKSIFNVHGAVNLAPLLAAWVLRVPVVWHFHETIPNYSLLVRIGRAFLSFLHHRLVVVAGKAALVYHLENYVVLHSSVDLCYWSRLDLLTEQSRGRKSFNILCVGNLNPLKGQDVLLDALTDFPGHWALCLIGEKLSNWASYSQVLEHKASRLCKQNSKGKIEFTGWRDSDQIRDRLLNCDVFVLPSRSEACPIVLLEAMAMGCVCVATDVGGVSEIINNSSVGYIIPSEDPIALSNTLSKIYSMSKEERISMGIAARKTIEESFSLDRIASGHLKLYYDLSGG